MITLPLPGIQALEQKPKRTPVSPDIRKLYPQQKEAFFGLCDFIQDPDCHIALLSGSQSEVIIRVVTNEGLDTYDGVLKLMAAHAKAQPKGSYAASAAWREFYGFARLFADINYNYSLTIHRMQGSTYENLILMETDILANRNVAERNRILYTGVTRPRQRLFIV